MEFFEIPGLVASVDKVVFTRSLETPPDRPYAFVYFITIRNGSQEVVIIRGRKWVVTDTEGRKNVVEGDGVVGRMPQLSPGEEFSYNSYMAVACDSVAQGSYFGVTALGKAFRLAIPDFHLEVP